MGFVGLSKCTGTIRQLQKSPTYEISTCRCFNVHRRNSDGSWYWPMHIAQGLTKLIESSAMLEVPWTAWLQLWKLPEMWASKWLLRPPLHQLAARHVEETRHLGPSIHFSVVMRDSWYDHGMTHINDMVIAVLYHFINMQISRSDSLDLSFSYRLSIDMPVCITKFCFHIQALHQMLQQVS